MEVIDRIVKESLILGYKARKKDVATIILEGKEIKVTPFITDADTIPEILSAILKFYRRLDYLGQGEQNKFDWDKVKDNLIFCIQPKSTENILKLDFLDLEMYVRIDENTNKLHTTYKVTKNSFPGIETTEIFGEAITQMIKRIECTKMSDWVSTVEGSNGKIPYILSTKDHTYGAAALCHIAKLREIASEWNDDLIILPSSIHECIIYPMDGATSLESYTEIVQDINRTHVDLYERLSNHAYMYSKDEDKIFW